MSESPLKSWHVDLEDLLGLAIPPVAIAFVSYIPTGVRRIERALPPVTADGRTGTVAASCVFWIEAAQAVFATVTTDHAGRALGYPAAD